MVEIGPITGRKLREINPKAEQELLTAIFKEKLKPCPENKGDVCTFSIANVCCYSLLEGSGECMYKDKEADKEKNLHQSELDYEY